LVDVHLFVISDGQADVVQRCCFGNYTTYLLLWIIIIIHRHELLVGVAWRSFNIATWVWLQTFLRGMIVLIILLLRQRRLMVVVVSTGSIGLSGFRNICCLLLIPNNNNIMLLALIPFLVRVVAAMFLSSLLVLIAHLFIHLLSFSFSLLDLAMMIFSLVNQFSLGGFSFLFQPSFLSLISLFIELLLLLQLILMLPFLVVHLLEELSSLFFHLCSHLVLHFLLDF